MKYSRVDIAINPEGYWEVRITRGFKKTSELTTKPTSDGYYYYPETESDEEAFRKLKELLINQKSRQIRFIADEISNINVLFCPKNDNLQSTV